MICSSAPEEGSRRGSLFQDQIVTSRVGEKVSKLQPGRADHEHQIVYRLHRSPQALHQGANPQHRQARYDRRPRVGYALWVSRKKNVKTKPRRGNFWVVGGFSRESDRRIGETRGRWNRRIARVSHPKLKVLLTSGYMQDVVSHRGVLERDISYVPKPFSPKELAAKICETLLAGS